MRIAAKTTPMTAITPARPVEVDHPPDQGHGAGADGGAGEVGGGDLGAAHAEVGDEGIDEDRDTGGWPGPVIAIARAL
ncbi:hypothetical protein [Streptomyces deserti]